MRAESWSASLEFFSVSGVAQDDRLAARIAHQLRRNLHRVGLIARERDGEFIVLPLERGRDLGRVDCAESANQPCARQELGGRWTVSVCLRFFFYGRVAPGV